MMGYANRALRRMNFSHNPLLVFLSVLVAIQASYVGLSLAQHIPGAFALNRRLLIAGAAFSLAIGIWGMHFIGMLAIKAQFTLEYDVQPTLVSFLVCGLVTGTAIYLASLRALRMLVVAAAVMGLGIAAMHYIGMLAIHGSAHLDHDPLFVLASMAIAVAASGLALWLAFAAQKRPSLPLCATVLGCAISGMHYTAMAGTSLHLLGQLSGPASAVISTDLLAGIVSIVAFSISGLFMLTLIPDRNDVRDWESAFRAANAIIPPVSPASEHIPEIIATQLSAPAFSLVNQAAASAQLATLPPVTLPIEKQGNRFHIAAAQIVSVHANAHYTYVFNGHEDFFCQMSITEIDARLPKEWFFRTHRSYIVNLAHVMQVRKMADAGIAELDSPLRRTVPVSRSRVAALRQELAAFQVSLPAKQP
jgi:diguanylate cyclase